MATRTIARMFDDHATARAAVAELETAGFSSADVSLVAGDAEGRYSSTTGDTTTTVGDADSPSEGGTGAGVGATLGTVLGGGAGLLAGIGALAIPGVGPIVAAGALVAALTGAGAGAAAGGLIGALAGSGVSDEDAKTYSEGVQRGGTLVTVRADETRASTAEAILDRHGPTTGGATGLGGTTTTTTTASGTMAGMTTSSDPDGTGTNPRGTMLSRGADDALGTNVSGARPENEVRTTTQAATAGAMGAGLGAAVVPPLTGGARADSVTVGRTMHRQDIPLEGGTTPAGLTSSSPDGTGDNPRGTMLSRGLDDALGTNVSGARPEHEVMDRPGTSASRAFDDAAGTNTSGARPMSEATDPPGTMASRAFDQAAGTNVSGASATQSASTAPKARSDAAATRAMKEAEDAHTTRTTPSGTRS